MKRVLAIVAVVCLVASVSSAAELLVQKWICDRDNFNDTSNTLRNYGEKCNARIAKDKQETTLYVDWSQDQYEEINAMMATPPPAPYTAWEVRVGVSGVGWEGANPAAVIWFGAFQSLNDWNANESCDNTVGDDLGACNSWADSVPTPEVPWLNLAGNAVSFWGLPELTNSVPIVGFLPSPAPGTEHLMQAKLDPAVLYKLKHDETCRGLRFWSEAYLNHQVYARGQWGCPGPAATALKLYAVPEPATMLLIAVGGVLLLRKKR
jgi:hypothetical protein